MENKVIGYTAGVFDMFHIGHLNILQRAKEPCEYLIVGVSTDELVQNYKHKTPIIPFAERVAIVEAIRYADKVVPQTSMDKFEAVRQLQVDAVFVGSDWQGTPAWQAYEKQFAEVNCDVVYLRHTEGISSTVLRERLNKE